MIFLLLGGKHFQFCWLILSDLASISSDNMFWLLLLDSLVWKLPHTLKGEAFTFFHPPFFFFFYHTSQHCPSPHPLLDPNYNKTQVHGGHTMGHCSQLTHEVYDDCISFPDLFCFVFPSDVCVLLLLALFYVYAFINIYHWCSLVPQIVWNASENRFSNNFIFTRNFWWNNLVNFGLIALDLLHSCHPWDLHLPLSLASPWQFSFLPSLFGRFFNFLSLHLLSCLERK